MRKAITLLPVCLLGACVAADGGSANRSSSSFPNPGVTYFDAEQRLAYLSTSTCHPMNWPSLANFQPGPIGGGTGVENYDTRGIEFAEALNGTAMLYLDHGSTNRADEAIAALRRFADADAFRLQGHINSSAYALARITQFILPAWQILLTHDGLMQDDGEVIDAWLERLVTRVMREQPARNNHQTSQGMTLVLAGVILNRRDWFDRGIRIGYRDQIRQIRPDGSWPLEAARGRRALIYTSRNIAHLLVIAETARAQGIDLYSVSYNGRTLDDAIRFMLAARRDNSLVDGYAQANQFVPDRVAEFRPNTQEDPFAGHDTSWVPIYANRFPATVITEELRRLKPRAANQGIRFSAVGGNVTCAVGL